MIQAAPACWKWLAPRSPLHHQRARMEGSSFHWSLPFPHVTPPSEENVSVIHSLLGVHLSLDFVIDSCDSDHGSLNSAPRWQHPTWFSRHPGSIVTGMVFVQEIGEVAKGQIAGGTTSEPGLCLGKGVHTDAPSHHHSSPQTSMGYHH